MQKNYFDVNKRLCANYSNVSKWRFQPNCCYIRLADWTSIRMKNPGLAGLFL